jgi:hypothetical protein
LGERVIRGSRGRKRCVARAQEHKSLGAILWRKSRWPSRQWSQDRSLACLACRLWGEGKIEGGESAGWRLSRRPGGRSCCELPVGKEETTGLSRPTHRFEEDWARNELKKRPPTSRIRDGLFVLLPLRANREWQMVEQRRMNADVDVGRCVITRPFSRTSSMWLRKVERKGSSQGLDLVWKSYRGELCKRWMGRQMGR